MNKLPALRALVTALVLAPAAVAWAHPGHGDESTLLGLLHMPEPLHLLPVLVVVAAAAVRRRRLRRSKGLRAQDKA